MKKTEILKAATIIFAEKGYGASLTEIADMVNIKKQSIYNYFESKDELFYEMIQNEVSFYFDMKKEEFGNLKDLGTEEKLRIIFFSIIDYFKDSTKLRFWRWLMLIDSKQLYEKTVASIHEHEVRFINLMQNIINEGIETHVLTETSYKGLLRMYLALIQGTLDAVSFYNELVDPDEFADSVWQSFWNGVKKR